jgi:type VI secretion system protein VasD
VTHPRRTHGLLVLLVAALADCGKTPPATPPALPPITIAAPEKAKVKASMTLTAAKDVNPDAGGTPKPIVVRIYTLRADTAFVAADFFALLNDDEKTLGAEMITHDEYVLDPGDSKSVDITIPDEARFVAVFAGFRDFRNAKPWRVAIPPPKGSFTISVERARVAASSAAG